MHIHNAPPLLCCACKQHELAIKGWGTPRQEIERHISFCLALWTLDWVWSLGLHLRASPCLYFPVFFYVSPFFLSLVFVFQLWRLRRWLSVVLLLFKALGPSMTGVSPFEGYVTLYHLHRTMVTTHCTITKFCAKSVEKCLVHCVLFFFFLPPNTSNVCINIRNILLWFGSC